MYGSRPLDPETRERLERHMAECEGCREFVSKQRALWAALDAWAPKPVSHDFDTRLYARIAAEQHVPWWKRWAIPRGSFSWRPALSLVAACLTIVAGLLLQPPSVPEVRNRGRMETVDVEQVERVLEDMDMLRQLTLTSYPEAEAPKPL
jgi:anti-sigma factor RsiW